MSDILEEMKKRSVWIDSDWPPEFKEKLIAEVESLTTERDELLSGRPITIQGSLNCTELEDKNYSQFQEIKTLEAENVKLKILIKGAIEYFQGVLLDHLPNSFAENPIFENLEGNIKCTKCGAVFPDKHTHPCNI